MASKNDPFKRWEADQVFSPLHTTLADATKLQGISRTSMISTFMEKKDNTEENIDRIREAILRIMPFAIM